LFNSITTNKNISIHATYQKKTDYAASAKTLTHQTNYIQTITQQLKQKYHTKQIGSSMPQR